MNKPFNICAAEIRRDMMLAGYPTIDDIGPDLVRPAGLYRRGVRAGQV